MDEIFLNVSMQKDWFFKKNPFKYLSSLPGNV